MPLSHPHSHFHFHFRAATVDLRQGYGDLLVGARNHIYKLNKDTLDVMDQIQTGPVLDSVLCRPGPLPCNATRMMTDNDNQLLLIRYNNKPEPVVLSCGTVQQVSQTFARRVCQFVIPLAIAGHVSHSQN